MFNQSVSGHLYQIYDNNAIHVGYSSAANFFDTTVDPIMMVLLTSMTHLEIL